MEESEKNVKISYAKNLNQYNFNTIVTIPIDSNVTIKNILNIDSYLYDYSVECVNGKAILKGKLSTEVVYVDTDGITNKVFETQNFTETYSDSAITSETFINIENHSVSSNILSSDSTLKISCDIHLTPVAYMNLGVPNSTTSNEMMICKRKEIQTNTISNFINTQFEHVSVIETKEEISKVLCNTSNICVTNVEAEDGYAVVEGKINHCVVIEYLENDTAVIKEIKHSESFKHDIEIAELKKGTILDLSFAINKTGDDITTEIENNSSFINIKNRIKVCGVAIKPISVDVIDDMYSIENEIETTISQRDYSKNVESFNITETIANELTLGAEETAIDEIIANLNTCAEITNTYIKDGTIHIEGIVSSTLICIDENKDYKNKFIELPFVINTKIPAVSLGCTNSQISILDCRTKVKRGTIIEIEYTVFAHISTHTKETHQVVDNFTIGKAINFGNYDYQIFIAKQGESLWDLAKRIKISTENLMQYNKNLPLVMEGGEKVIIKR